MRKETENWVALSEYDINTAEQMFSTGRYLYVVFMCHLCIEKLIKAIVHEETGKLPPKSHDLIYLSNLAGIKFTEGLLDIIGKINSASIITRYPGDISKAVSAYPEDVARGYLDKTKEVLKWLKQDKRLKE
jgi:HEPN domain-containing protein